MVNCTWEEKEDVILVSKKYHVTIKYLSCSNCGSEKIPLEMVKQNEYAFKEAKKLYKAKVALLEKQ